MLIPPEQVQVLAYALAERKRDTPQPLGLFRVIGFEKGAKTSDLWLP
jgi:hypothetical protein